MNPAQIHALLQTALAHHKAGRSSEAEVIYRRVRAAAPNNFDAWQLSGTLALQDQRVVEARGMFEKALRLKPDSALCLLRLGIACQHMNDLPKSEECLRQAVQRNPQLAEAWNHLAVTLRAQGRRPEAHAAYERAVAVKPDYHEAHDRLGALVAECSGHAAAVPHFQRAVAVAPGYAAGWSNLGASLVMLGRLREAEEALSQALTLAPNNVQALTGRALVMERDYRLAEAMAAFAKIIAQVPNSWEAWSARLLGLHYLDDVSATQLAEEHRAYGRTLPEAVTTPLVERTGQTNKLRVGFLSPDLRRHSVAYFLRPLLRGLDRARFETYLYHDHAQCDVVSREFAALADQWRHVAGLPSSALEKTIGNDAPDILIDLAGHTAGNRLVSFARRLAPVQISYLGYPDTTGVPAMDFRFVDAVSDPMGTGDDACTEQLVRFAPTAWVYSPPTDAPEIEPKENANESPVTFGCFNNFAKIGDATLRAWAAILTALPDARLMLKGAGLGEATLLARQRERLARCGLDPARVKFLERTATTTAHLATYNEVDVALDTFPYHGTTTTCEALWMGVPVVTLRGDRHAARVGASLLQAIGRDEWVTEDWPGYIAQAVALARDAKGRVAWRRDARTVMQHSPLLDEVGQAARFGEALMQCWQAHTLPSPRG